LGKKDHVDVENVVAAKQKIVWNALTVWIKSNMVDPERKSSAASKGNVCKPAFIVKVCYSY